MFLIVSQCNIMLLIKCKHVNSWYASVWQLMWGLSPPDRGQFLYWPLRAAVLCECGLPGGSVHAAAPSFPGSSLCQALEILEQARPSCQCALLEMRGTNKRDPVKWTADCTRAKTQRLANVSLWSTVFVVGCLWSTEMKRYYTVWCSTVAFRFNKDAYAYA